MALRRLIYKRRLFPAVGEPLTPPITSKNVKPQFALASTADSPDLTEIRSFFRRFLQRRWVNNSFSSRNLSGSDNLKEKLKSFGVSDQISDRLHLEVLQPTFNRSISAADARFSLKLEEARKLLRFVQLEKVRRRLKNIPANTITYSELVRICSDSSGTEEVGPELAKALDESGNVVVLGGTVFLRPAQVTKSIEKLIEELTILPNDPRREELAHLERMKAQIDEKAHSLVQRELSFGLGLLVLLTLGFMRLTFWELTWDVMEPICFFTTSFHFLLAYAFFLRTSTEPSFVGLFNRRFRVKQKKLMHIRNFDVERYDCLRDVFYSTTELS